MGWFRVKPDSIEIYPGGDSYFQEEAGLIRFQEGRVSQIISLRDNTERPAYLLEPELITNLFDSKREKRRIVHFQEIPPLIVNAVLSAEDKRFFQHAGFDPLRILKSAYVDIKSGRNAMGASTLSMQLARSLWLTTERTWRRKIPEIFITLHLERKLTKEQIFEHYANTIYIGQVSSFAVHGFGEGAQAYFGKDLRQLTLPEAALLAQLKAAGAIIQGSATTVEEARWLEAQGADAIIAQGLEAGGHRGMFLTRDLGAQVGTLALVPQVVDAVRVPVIAAGGIADARGIVAALALGASAVQIGTAYLLCHEAKISQPFRAALRAAGDQSTVLTNVFSGRPARAIRNRLICEVGPISSAAPPFPLAAASTQPLRLGAEARGSADFSPLLAGQAAALAREAGAGALTLSLANEARSLLARLADTGPNRALGQAPQASG